MAGAESLAEQFGLRALAHARRPQQHETARALQLEQRDGAARVVAFESARSFAFPDHRISLSLDSDKSRLAKCGHATKRQIRTRPMAFRLHSTPISLSFR